MFPRGGGHSGQGRSRGGIVGRGRVVNRVKDKGVGMVWPAGGRVVARGRGYSAPGQGCNQGGPSPKSLYREKKVEKIEEKEWGKIC